MRDCKDEHDPAMMLRSSGVPVHARPWGHAGQEQGTWGEISVGYLFEQQQGTEMGPGHWMSREGSGPFTASRISWPPGHRGR